MTRPDDGFTILEALVAFAILSLMLVSVYGIGGTSMRGIERAEGVDRAVLLAQSKLAEIATIRTVLPEKSEGVFPGTTVHWRIDARDTAPARGGDLRLQDVHLELAWRDGDVPHGIAVDTRHLGTVAE